MVNIGKPSGGCHACRRMRVKCDERRPGCNRCERGARECPGYRDDLPIFRDMNDASQARALFPRQKRKQRGLTPSSQPGSARIEKRSTSLSPQRRASTSGASPRPPTAESQRRSSASPLKHGELAATEPSKPLSMNWEDAAVAYYLTHFTISSEKGSGIGGYFNCLPDLLSEATSGGHLEVALKSVALSVVGNQSCMEQLKVQARHYYGQALVQVHLALDDSTMAKADATLATLILLGQYEIISGDRPGHSLWMSHGEGQTVVLGLRGVESLREDRSRQLFRVAQVGLQLSNVASKPSRKPWHVKPPADLFPNSLSQRFYDFNEKAFETHRTIKSLMQEEWRDGDWHERLHTTVLCQHELIEESEQITKECQEQSMFWLADTTNTLNRSHIADTEGQNALQSNLPPYVYLFSNILSAGNLLYFWALCSKTLESMLASAAILEGTHYTLPPTVQPVALQQKLAACIDDLCGALPFALGEVDSTGALTVAGSGTCVGAYHALWPLHVLCSLRTFDAARRAWLLACLTQVDALFGIRQAALLRDYWMQRTPLGAAAPPPPPPPLAAGPSRRPLTASPAPTVPVAGAGWGHDDDDDDEPNAAPGSVWFPIV